MDQKNTKTQSLLVLFVSSILALTGCGEVSGIVSDSSKGILTPISPVHHLNIAGSASASVGACNPLILSILDANNGPIIPSEQKTILVAGFGSGSLYTDAACTSAVGSSVVFPAEKVSVPLFYKNNSSEIVSLRFNDETEKMIGALLQITLTAPEGTPTGSKKFSVVGSASLPVKSCRPYTLRLLNSVNQSTSESSATAVLFSGLGQAAVYTDSACTTIAAASTVTLPANKSFVNFWLKAPAVESLILSAEADTTSIESVFYPINVESSAKPPAQIQLSGVSQVTQGACSLAVVAQLVDTTLTPTITSTPVAMTVSGGAGFSAFSDSSCSVPLVNLTIPADQGQALFYFKSSDLGVIQVIADDGDTLGNGLLNVTVNPIVVTTPTRLAFSGPNTVSAGACSSAYEIKLVDDSNMVQAATGAITVNVTGSGAGTFYENSDCSGPMTSLSFVAGQSIKNFYFKSTTPANLIFNADDVGPLLAGSKSVTVQVGAPAQLKLSGTTNLSLNECKPYVVSTEDAYGNVSPLVSGLLVQFTAGSGGYFSDSSCLASISNMMMSTGTSSAVVYYKSSAAGSVTLDADDSQAGAAGIVNSSLTVNVVNLPASKLALSNPLLKAGVCTPMTVTIQSATSSSVAAGGAGQTVNLAATGGSFYSANNCAGGSLIGSVVVPNGSASATFYYLDTLAESVQITASAAGLSDASYSAAVSSNSPNKIILSGVTPMTAGACGSFLVTLQDGWNNTATVTSSLSVLLSSNGSGQFFSEASCTTASSTLNLSIGQSSGLVYFKDLMAENSVLTAAGLGLTSGTFNLTVNTAGPQALRLISANSIMVGQCLSVSAQVLDNFQNPVTLGADLSANLGMNGPGEYFNSLDCSGAPVSAVTILTGSSVKDFSFKSTTAQNINLTATSGGLTQATVAVAITTGAPHHLSLVGPAAIQAGSCMAFDIYLQDSVNNNVSVATATTLNLSGSGLGSFYSDNACATAVSSITLPAHAQQTMVYYKNSSIQSLTLSVDDPGPLAAGTKSVTVNANATTALAMQGSASAEVGQCSPFTLKALDLYSNLVTQPADLIVALGGVSSGHFYSDSSCTALNQITQASILSGQSTTVVYYKNLSAENVNLQAQALTAESLSISVSKAFASTPLPPSKLVLSGLTNVSGDTCVAYAVLVKDANNNVVPTGTTKIISFGGGGTGAFYSDAACTALSGNATLGPVDTQVIFYYKATDSQFLTLSADDSGGSPDLTAATLNVTLIGVGGAMPMIGFAESSRTLSENAVSYNIKVVLDKTSAADVTAQYIVSGTSSPGSDHNLTNGMVTIPAGQKSVLIPVTIYDDPLQEPTETLIVQLAAPVGAGFGAITQMTISILDNDSPAALSLVRRDPFLKDLINANPKIAQGYNHACILNNGAVYCVGNGSNGQLGDGNGSNSPTAYVGVSGLSTGVTDLVSGGQSSCAIKNGSLYCWGYNGWGNLGTGDTTLRNSPVLVLDVSAGVVSSVKIYSSSQYSYTTCAIQGTTLKCWGQGMSNSPQTFLSGAGITDYSVGFSHACGVQNGALKCWGDNSSGQLGDGTITASPSTAVSVTGLASNVTNVISDNLVTCAIQSGSLKCWGENASGAIGTGSGGADVTSPYAVLASGVTKVVVSEQNVCAVQSGGVKCWGKNSFGEVQSTTSNDYIAKPSPVLVLDAGSGVVTDIQMKYSRACAIQGGALKCWGKNDNFQVGSTSNGGTNNYYGASPAVPLNSATGNVTSFVLGNSHTCAIQTGIMKCWGAGSFYQINPLLNSTTEVPQTVGTQALTIGAGNQNTCALLGVWYYCWGGSMGNNAGFAKSMAIPISGAKPISAIAKGGSANHMCVLANGRTKCWGNNGNNQLGTASANGVQESKISGASQVAVGASHSCAIHGGSLKCWGLNSSGQLGNNSTIQSTDPVQVVGLTSGVTKVSTGGQHTCAIQNGNLFCWGSNSGKQVSNTASSPQASPVQVLTGNVTDVTLGNTVTCAVQNGSLYCWGDNTYGQVGQGNTATPVTAPYKTLDAANGTITSISAGQSHICAVQNNTVKCWGYNTNYQIDSSAANKSSPLNITGITGTISGVSAGSGHTCVIQNDNLVCWGTITGSSIYQNTFLTGGVTDLQAGQGYQCALQSENLKCFNWSAGALNMNLINQSAYLNSTPALFSARFFYDLVPYQGFAVQSGVSHSCAILSGKIYCWGDNTSGQLGQGDTTARTSAVEITSLKGAVDLAVGAYHTCALANSKVYCWGGNNKGQLGLGSSDSSPHTTPVEVTTLAGSRFIRAGDYHTCAKDASDAIKCWGDNTNGQLGLGDNTQRNQPVVVGKSFFDLKLGKNFTCGIDDFYQVYCWGDNSKGQMGDGTAALEYKTPNLALGLSNAVDLVAGSEHACMTKNDGSVLCWGANAYSQLGDGTTANRNTAVTVSGLSGVIGLSAGQEHTCALKNTGQAQCWGDNYYGQLAIGPSGTQTAPQTIPLVNDFVGLGAGRQHTCGIRAGGFIGCSGDNSSGQLGIGSMESRSTIDYVQGL
ncbi:Calx-beta domain-containing protein [Bdellovibrio sp.]|uniref:Calx-beta domain-containing protein n=1 Tax=Bdellovibrio sp. TaxID=28201 RepID=UPI0039E7276A